MFELETKSFFENLRIQGCLLSVDFYFAEKLNLKTEEEIAFAAYLFSISREGHLCLKIEDGKIYPEPFIEDEDLKNIFIQKVILGSNKLPNAILSEPTEDFPSNPICKLKNYYYLQRNYVFETQILKNLQRLLDVKCEEDFLKEGFLKKIDQLTDEQKQALLGAISHNFYIINGGPGTGKTYIASILIKILDEIKKSSLKVTITAPTGKAALHLKNQILKQNENISFEAKTLHSLLSMKENKNRLFNRKKIDADLVIVDEASMIDVRIFSYLLDAIDDSTRIIIMGDASQLSPVESGNVFSQLAKIDKIPSYKLSKPMRFDNIDIYNFSMAIEHKRINEALDILEQNRINFIDTENFKVIINSIYKFSKDNFLNSSLKYPDPKQALAQIDKFRILGCVRKGLLGIEQINKDIFSYILDHISYDEYISVPIVITQNDYRLELYNGMIGSYIFQKRNKDEGLVYFHSEDNEILSFPIFMLSKYELGFCLSVHKSQGSEFNEVLLILNSTDHFGKEILYTAVTRAKKQLTIIGSKSVIENTIKKDIFKQSAIRDRIN